MFKVGDKVRIKPREEIEDLDMKLNVPLPLSTLWGYCGKVGQVVRVIKDCRNGLPFIKLDITENYNWYGHELTLYRPDKIFISLEDLCLQ